ncbi:MAG TPA: hypothetical protein VL691_20350 [Vicinamibacteria bacterium]|nr:hypothetical protein [Vicinamibacteria bacterium]
MGGVTFASVGILSAALLARVAGSLSPGVGLVSLVAGMIAGALAVGLGGSLGASPAGAPGGVRRLVDALALAAFAAVSLRQFGWLVFENGGALLNLVPYNYGDLPLHWTYVSNLAGGASFWPENPILTGERLRYPFGVDLLTAAFVQLGASLRALLPIMGLVGAALAALALRRWGGALAVAGFLFAGGLAGFQVLWTGRVEDYQAAVAWKNLFLALFVPQRGYLVALPVGLVLLCSWRRRLLHGERGLAPWVEGVLWGALPLVHLHTFLFVSLVAAMWALGGGRVRAALPPLAWALAPAAWSVWEVTEGFRAASLVGWKPGWMIGAQDPLVFLLVNFGFFLPLALAALALALLERRRADLLVLGPALAFLAGLFLVRLAPWEWDNTKVMVWCYVAALPPIGSLVLSRLARTWRVALVVGLLFSGGVSVTGASLGRGPRLELLDLAEHDGVCRALGGVRTRRVATVQTFNHPVALCGRPIVAGYPGHLWSHGLDASAVERRLARLMRGEAGWREEARALGASHVFWGARERQAYPDSRRPWADAGAPVAVGPWGALYAVE